MKKIIMSVFSWLLIFTFVLSALPHIPAEAAFTEIEFSDYVSDSHPRLYVTSFDGLKQKYLSDPLTAKWYAELINNATVISDCGVMCDADGNKLYDIDKLIEQMSGRKYRRIISSQDILARFYILAFAAACEDSEALADRLWLEIEDAINLPYWNTRHWLETAEMMHSISIAYDWCYKFWSDEQKKLMEDAVFTLGVDTARQEYNGNPKYYRWHYGFGGTEVGTNWTIVCNTGVLLASLAFYDTNPTFYNTKMNNAIRSMKAGLNAYSADGSYNENLNYWNYATRNLIMATDAFENAIGGDFDKLPPIEAPFHYDFTKAPGISITPDFPIYANGPAGVFNYGDASGGSLTSSPAFMWLGNRYAAPHYTDYHLDNLERKGHSGINIPLDLLWYEGGESGKNLPQDRLFDDDFASLRSSWDDDGAMWIAMKGGPNGKPHNHYDIGTFAIDYDGVRFFRQLGAIGYDWEGTRSQFYKGRTEGQNTVVVNPDASAGQHVGGTSEFEAFYSDTASSYAVLNMTDIYSTRTVVTSDAAGNTISASDATTVTSARRGIKMYHDKTRIVVQDEFTMSSPSEFYWFAHPNASVKDDDIEIYNNGKSARVKCSGRYLYMNIVSNQNAKFEVMEATPLPASPTPEDQKINATIKLAIHLTGVTDVSLAVEMIGSMGTEPAFSGYMTPMDSWHPENDVVRFGRGLTIYGDDKPGRTATMLVKSPLGYIYGIGQETVDSKGEYVFNCTLPEDYENGIYSVYLNGSLYKTFEVTDGTDAGVSPASYTLSYELPEGVDSSVLVAAEYQDGCLIQLTSSQYDKLSSSATVSFRFNPSKGNTLKFFYLDNLTDITPLYPHLEMVVD